MTRPLECRLHVDIARLYASPQLVAGRQRYFRLRGARAVAKHTMFTRTAADDRLYPRLLPNVRWLAAYA